MMRIVQWLLVVSLVTSVIVPSGVVGASEQTDVVAPSVGKSEELISLQSVQPVLIDEDSQLPVRDTSLGVGSDMALPTDDVVSTTSQTTSISQPAALGAVAISPSPPVQYPETTPDLIVTTFSSTNYLDVIEFYNQSSVPIDMSNVEIIVGDGRLNPADSLHECSLRPSAGWLLPKRYVTMADSASTVVSSQRLMGECVFAPGASVVSVQVLLHGVRIQLIEGVLFSAGQAYARHIHAQDKSGQRSVNASLRQKGSFSTDYKTFNNDLVLLDDALYVPPVDNQGLVLSEIMTVPRSCLPSESEFDCGDYIELRNTSVKAINIAEYRVRAGTLTNATTLTWHEPTLSPERDELMLAPGQYFLLRLENDGDLLSLTNGASNVWLEDYFGTKVYDEVAYVDMDKAAANGMSWSLDKALGSWRLGVPSPAVENTFPVESEPGKGSGAEGQIRKACRDDQYRSEETGRCRAIVATSTLMPCREGQYRSEDTNRCRSITATVASVLKPCADDQFRNPDTGRCKKIASSDELALADCGEGRERNPDTNRCRNVTSIAQMPQAAFAVESIKDTTQAFVGWWALGGVAFLALGYGAWEWRREVGLLFGKIGTFFHSGK
ncbi:hypothetical protein D3C73_103510 [compost metagenome]